MGWGITFRPDIFLSKQSYASISLVKERIEELDGHIASSVYRLTLLAAFSPKDIVPDEYKDDIPGWVEKETHRILEWYSSDLIEKFKLSLYLDYLDGDESKLIKSE